MKVVDMFLEILAWTLTTFYPVLSIDNSVLGKTSNEDLVSAVLITGGEGEDEGTYSSSEMWTLDKQVLLSSPLSVRRAGYHVQFNRTICGGYEKSFSESDDALRSCETLDHNMEWNRDNITLRGERWGSIVFVNNNNGIVYIIGGVNGNQEHMEVIGGSDDSQLVYLEREIR